MLRMREQMIPGRLFFYGLVTAKQLESELGMHKALERSKYPDSDSIPAPAGQKKYDKLHFEIGYTRRG